MSVDSVNLEYSNNITKWKLCRDAKEGEDAVKACKETYVPKPKGWDSDDYDPYVERGCFFAAMSRSVDGLTGMLFRKKMHREEVDDSINELFEDVTNANESLRVFAADCVDEVLTVGRIGILVDFSDDTEGLSVAQAEQLNARPFWTLYQAEQIINWQTKKVQGHGLVLSRVVLKEVYTYNDAGDPYNKQYTTQYRDLYLDENNLYVQDIYREDGDGGTGTSVPVETVYPMMNGERMSFIPFVFCNSKNNDYDIQKPPMVDMARINVHHFRVDCDRAHMLHFVGLPTPYIFGGGLSEDQMKSLALGPTTAIIGNSAEVELGFMQIDTSGDDALLKRQEQFAEQMAKLGARLLSPDKVAAEATDTLIIRNQGEYSVLTRIANSVSMALTTATRWSAMWMGVSKDQADKIVVALNTDFNIKQLEANQLLALVSALQGGAISRETFHQALVQGELMPENRTVEDEVAAIEDQMGSIADMLGQENGVRATDDKVTRGKNVLREPIDDVDDDSEDTAVA